MLGQMFHLTQRDLGVRVSEDSVDLLTSKRVDGEVGVVASTERGIDRFGVVREGVNDDLEDKALRFSFHDWMRMTDRLSKVNDFLTFFSRLSVLVDTYWYGTKEKIRDR